MISSLTIFNFILPLHGVKLGIPQFTSSVIFNNLLSNMDDSGPASVVCPGHSRPVVQVCSTKLPLPNSSALHSCLFLAIAVVSSNTLTIQLEFSDPTPDGTFLISACLGTPPASSSSCLKTENPCSETPVLATGSAPLKGTKAPCGPPLLTQTQPSPSRAVLISPSTPPPFISSPSRLWNAINGEQLRSFEAKGVVKSVAFSNVPPPPPPHALPNATRTQNPSSSQAATNSRASSAPRPAPPYFRARMRRRSSALASLRRRSSAPPTPQGS
jgi:hypothetical protein